MNIFSDNYMIFHPDHEDIVNSSAGIKPGLALSRRPGHEVTSYRALLKKIASLNFYNSRFRILFRGQSDDNTDSMNGSSLLPPIFRHFGQNRKTELNERFKLLTRAEEKLKKRFIIREIHQDGIVRWAILQHYQVVDTPLLDVTQSLQTALSFALKKNKGFGYLFALAFPLLTGPISVSIESMTQVIDLTRVCPPEALRPHFQSGILVGDYPLITQLQYSGMGKLRNNFSCRLLSKFKLTNCEKWADEGFVHTHNDILYPNSYDSWYNDLTGIKNEL